MELFKPNDIEWCIEVMAGNQAPPRVPKRKGVHLGSYIKLARYDVNFVNNVSSYIRKQEGMTSRQRELAVKLTDKYRKQFRQIGIDATHLVTSPVFSQAERKVDRTKKMWFTEEWIYLQFPYNQDLIKDVNQFLRDDVLLHNGHSKWHQLEKRWAINYTEYNFLQLYEWGLKQDFKFDDECKVHYNELLKITNNPNDYIISARLEGNSLVLVNAPETLQTYWDEHYKEETPLVQIKACSELGLELDKTVLDKYNFNIIEKSILTGVHITTDKELDEVVFTCLDLGYKKIAVGLSSHSEDNVKTVKKILDMYKTRYGNDEGLVISGKSKAFDNLTTAEDPVPNTKLLITDRMSRLHNTEWDFESEITIGQGMFSKRNIFKGAKVIEIRPKESGLGETELFKIDGDEIF
jgi:hypothetical protein